MRTVAVAGHICVDLTPGLGRTVEIQPGALTEVGPLRFSLGGAVANTARTLVGLEHPLVAYATVGDDELGGIIARNLPGPLVDARISVGCSATSYSLVLEPSGGDRTFWHHTGANGELDGTGIDLDGIDLLHLGYPPLLPAMIGGDGEILAEFLTRARRGGTTTSIDLAVVDPNSPTANHDWLSILRRTTGESDVMTPSLDDLVSALGTDIPGEGPLDERFAELLIGWGAAVVTISSGSEGILLRTASRARLRAAGRAVAPLADAWADVCMRAPARLVETVVTTNGAGDAASAGLLYALSCGLNPRAALAVSVACSASIVEGRVPSRAEVARAEVARRVPEREGGTVDA